MASENVSDRETIFPAIAQWLDPTQMRLRQYEWPYR